MAERCRKRAPLDRGIEQAIVSLKKGAHLLKCGRRGKPKFCPFRLSADEKVLIWYSGEKEKQLKLKSVFKIVLGQKTVNFLRHPQAEKESQSFSLIYQNGERSLDLTCKDREQAESWFLGLTALLPISIHPWPLAGLRVSRGAHSCASSPVTHVQRKYRQGFLEGSPQLSQVHSLYASPPRSAMERFFSGTMSGSSDIFYPSKPRTLSDVQPILDEMLPHLPHAVSESFKKPKDSDMFKEHSFNFHSKIISSDRGTPMSDKTDTLTDVFIWGEGIGRFLGDGLHTNYNADFKSDALVPKLLHSAKMLEADSISCGEKHAALVTKQGDIFCWGEESSGRLGHKINIDVNYPKLIESLSNVNVQTISCGSHHTCAVSNTGEVYSWGDKSMGNPWFPQRIRGILDGIHISRVSCGEWHTAIISTTGQLFTYGEGTFGVLGQGNLQNVSYPKEVESLKGLRVKSVACGPWHTAAIVEVTSGRSKSNMPCGKLFTWGDGDKGQLGHSDKERRLLPACVASLVDYDFIQVSCGRTLTVALTVTGIAFTIGSAVHGQLGNPQAKDASIATVEGCLKCEFVKEISSGSFHVAVLTAKGKVYAWGKGENGRLGLGDTRDRNYPTLVEALEDRLVYSVVCGSNFTAAICSHKSISSKGQTVCSRCHMIFRFTRKKHNCYNCGFVFCHSCTSRKAMNASLAPNKGKKYRVCDPCLVQLQRIVEPRINEQITSPRNTITRLQSSSSGLTLRREESFFSRSKFSSPIDSNEDIKFIQRKASSTQDSFPPFIGEAQRWGQVSCPFQFSGQTREISTSFVPMHWEEYSNNSHALSQTGHLVSLSLLPKSSSLKQDLTEMDKLLSEELQRLRAEVIFLAEQCQAKSLKICQYKCKIEETWALARDEAAKCKAAKDVIKILTNQMNALSEKLSKETRVNTVKSMSEDAIHTPCQRIHVPTPRPIQREMSEEMLQSDPIINGRITTQNDTSPLEECEQRVQKTSRDEWVEQDEPGVYITFIALPSGQKGLKRVRFSRRKFSDKEAERWWKENQSRVYLKYSIERIVSSNRKQD